jgi:hypothetical protein
MSFGFVPIRFGDWVRLFLKSNPGENAKDVSARLRSALEAYKAGKRCACGEPIWVIGSAEAGHACFTCNTGEADPSEDYEIDDACDKYSVRSAVGGGTMEEAGEPREFSDDDVPF